VPARALFRTRKQKAIGLLCIFGAGAALIIHSPWAVLPRLKTITGSSQNGAAAGSGRLEIWQAAEAVIRDHPLFGTGYGSFPSESNYRLLNTPGVDLTYYYLRPTGAEAHNLYLGTWAELGIVGLVLYVGMIVSTALTLLRTARRARRVGADFVARLANGLLVGLCSWSITSFFLSTETARWFWIMLGLSLALPRLVPGDGR
jgi:O-antigen ligase